ncbi:unnamed protein product [Chrysodeixis includens]|uniref:Peptidase S1 domain-containing protein n=1 Tax=Chrysodeixis includens TaxID=689277 RepID=A0A9N8L237_CHRIL|nr:unnamed protein product [Chrysodeixis includens]
MSVDENPFVLPELTASFVVIGTKNMFDSGYENYLPIERVITHPKYKGWTANLALVYTFAGMTSDKPGSIIPLNEAGTTPVDSNVTVLSWGHCKDIEPSTLTRAPLANSDPNPDSKCDPQDSNSCDDKIPRRNGMYVKMKAPVDLSSEERQGDSEFDRVTAIPAWRSGPQLASSDINHRSHYERPDKSIPAQKNWNLTLRARVMLVTSKANKRLSRYLPSKDNGRNNKRKNTQKHSTQRHRYYKSKRNKKSDEDEGSAMLRAKKETGASSCVPILERSEGWALHANPSRRRPLNLRPVRDVQSMRERFRDSRLGSIKSPNSGVFLSEDAGAPAINQEQLVAVTMGGVLCEGDHVAVGIKMSCFCTWIAENLPTNQFSLNCYSVGNTHMHGRSELSSFLSPGNCPGKPRSEPYSATMQRLLSDHNALVLAIVLSYAFGSTVLYYRSETMSVEFSVMPLIGNTEQMIVLITYICPVWESNPLSPVQQSYMHQQASREYKNVTDRDVEG